MKPPEVVHWQSEEAPTEAGLRERFESMGYTVQRYVYQPGTRFPEHTHAVDKIDAVLSGRFQIVLEEKTVVLRAGDWLAVPRHTVHSAAVLGDEPVISLDAVKQR